MLRDEAPRRDGTCVLYWMIGARRTRWNFALEWAIQRARELDRPLWVLEPLRLDHPHAALRFHAFVRDGMAIQARRFSEVGIGYYPYLEEAPGAGKGLLRALASMASLVITDDSPVFFLPRAIEAAARQVPVRMEAVDGNGLLPMAITDRVFPTAFTFRRYVQQVLPSLLDDVPVADPLDGLRLPTPIHWPAAVVRRWPPWTFDRDLQDLPLPREVAPVASFPGGESAARERLHRFVSGSLRNYAETRKHPDDDSTSGLSPYLHFGHISPHEVFRAVAGDWRGPPAGARARGRREGWWGLDPDREAFLDQLVVWREIGLHFWRRPGAGTFEGIPRWAQDTLKAHAGDPREARYSVDELAQARTHDPVWNAAQRQLVQEGRIHNAMRMLWGKRVLEWTPHPEQAFEVLTWLNDHFALDGRDPNTSVSISWVFGAFDRPFGPERPVFGTVRCMTTRSALRRLRLRRWLAAYGPAEETSMPSPRYHSGGSART